MKLLLLQRFDLSSVSCARRILCQAEELLSRGHEVYLTDFTHEQRQSELPSVVDLTKRGLQIIQLNRQIKSFSNNITRLKELPKPDLIHLWKAYPDASLPALRLSRHWDIPLHYDWDDWEKGIAAELTGSSLAGWIAGLWDRHFPAFSDTISAASGFLKQRLIQEGFPEDRIWDAPVGADLQRFYPSTPNKALQNQLKLDSPVLVYSGQLEVASYAEQTIEVLQKVREHFTNAQLLILGGGRKLDLIRQRIKDMDLDNSVICTDYVPADDIPRYLSLADVALAPFEANDVTRAKSPLKIAEYMAMGLPVVASDIGEAPVMLSGGRMGEKPNSSVTAGACVPCNDISAMAETVLRILQSPDVQKSMSAAGQKNASERYNWKSHTDNLEQAYQAALALHHD